MNRRAVVVGLVWDVGLPVAVYYAGRWLGAETVVALLVGGAAAGIRTALVAVTRRRWDGVAAFVAATFLVLVGVWSLTGDDRVLLTGESILSGGLGLLLLASCAIRRPLMYALVRRLHASDADTLAGWDVRWREEPGFRALFTTPTLVWGAVLLAEAAIRVPLVYALPVDVGYAVSVLLQIATVVALLAWTVRYVRPRRRRPGP